MSNSNPVQEALRHRVRLEIKGDVENELKNVQMEISQLENLKTALFRLEDLGAKQLETRIQGLKNREAELEGVVKYSAKYPLLSAEVFRWRDGNGWPRLAVFGLDSPICFLRVHCIEQSGKRNFVREVEPPYQYLPDSVFNAWEDVFETLSKSESLQVGYEHSISMKFAGLIPDAIREKINAVNKEFEKIFIIAEANWEEKMQPSTDPLVVGWDGVNLWLIASFDTTKLEELLKREFTTRS